MYKTLFLLETLAPLEMFKNRLFYHILNDFLITPVNLRYIHAIYAKTKILDALVCFPDQLEMSL